MPDARLHVMALAIGPQLAAQVVRGDGLAHRADVVFLALDREQHGLADCGRLDLPPAPALLRIEAPMVGTFYRAPEPGASPFVGIGDVVVPGQTLCILEAMKLMNEVKVEHAGIVRAIHAENAQPVEYGQLLFELELADGRPPVL